MVVVFEAFSFRIPLQFVSGFDRDVCQMTYGGNSVADIDREIGILAALDTLQEIVVLTLGVGIEMDFVGADLCVEDFIGTGFDLSAPAAISYPPLGADKFNARIPWGARHNHSVGVMIGNMIILDG